MLVEIVPSAELRDLLYRRSIDLGHDWEGFHIIRPQSGSLVASFVLADWQVRVSGTSFLVYRPSDRL